MLFVNEGNLFLVKLGTAMPAGAYVHLAATCGHTHNYKQQLLISNGRIWTKWQALGLYMYGFNLMTTLVARQIKALELGCIVTEQGGNLVSALVNTQQYSRQKYMPLRHVQFRI
jgi:hypothetical protein